MVKVQDTYNPVTGEYVKRISDWVELTGVLAWQHYASVRTGSKWVRYNGAYTSLDYGGQTYKYDSKPLIEVAGLSGSDKSAMYSGVENLTVSNKDSGWNDSLAPTSAEVKAYFYGYKLANSDGTSPYYKSEVPYTPATWAEWTNKTGNYSFANNSLTLTNHTTLYSQIYVASHLKASVKYGVLANVVSNNLTGVTAIGNGGVFSTYQTIAGGTTGNIKLVQTCKSDYSDGSSFVIHIQPDSIANSITIKDVRVFELPTGSQIESDFTNLSADELSSKYTFNGLCPKNWKKVTDGTGLTSTLPTASYAGYTPYKMIYQLATPDISYLTPKVTIPLYDTNTIVETDTPSDCKADVTVGYKLKDGTTAVAGDITAPTPDYISAVTSVSELGDKKGIVRGKNLLPKTANYLPYSMNGLTFTPNTSDGSISISGTSTSIVDYYLFNSWQSTNTVLTLLKEKTFILSTGNANVSMYIGTNSTVTMQTGTPYTPTTDKVISYAFIRIQSGVTLSGAKVYPQIEENTIVTAYEPYTIAQATLPTLRKIGTVADTYNPETGVLVQRIGKKAFDGTENWVWINNDIYSTTVHRFNWEDSIYGVVTNNDTGFYPMYCNSFPVDTLNYGARDKNAICISGTGISIRIFTDKAQTATQLKAYLAQQYANGTPVTVYYQLVTPVVTTLATTALPTYKPTTLIGSDSTVKGAVSTDYKLKVNATPMAGDFIASPECVNDIKDLGNGIDVVSSVGRRNLYPNSGKFTNTTNWSSVNLVHENGKPILTSTGTPTNGTDIPLEHNTDYVFSAKIRLNVAYPITSSTPNHIYVKYSGESAMSALDGSIQLISNESISIENEWHIITIRFRTKGDVSKKIGLKFHVYTGSVPSKKDIEWVKLEKGTSMTIWTPAPEDIVYNTMAEDTTYKTNILLSAPLRSIGDVRDKLFKDSDGKWKVERNIGETVFNGTESWGKHSYSIDGEFIFASYNPPSKKTGLSRISCSHAIEFTGSAESLTNIANILTTPRNSVWAGSTSGSGIYLKIDNSVIKENYTTPLKAWLAGEHAKGTPVTIQYELATPTYEVLSQELQTKLDNIPTFPEHNYVYTVTNDNLQPTLHVDYKKLSWLRSRLLLNSLKIYSRNLTDNEMIQNYKVEKERFGM